MMRRLAVVLICTVFACRSVWAQSPRATQAPGGLDFPSFSQRLLATRADIALRPVHFIFMVDVSASVGDIMLGSWRTGLYEPMLEGFLVAGDRVSVVPFGLHPWWDDAHLNADYTRAQRAHLYTGTFPTTVKPPRFKGTDIYGSVAEALQRAEKEGWTAHHNIVLIVVTDDQIQDASASANTQFQRLRGRLLSSASDVMRLAWRGPHGRKDYTVMVFTNPFPDTTRLPSPRQTQVAHEQQTQDHGGSGGANGTGGNAGGTAGTAGSGHGGDTGSGSEAQAAPPDTKESGFWPPPWWFWAALAAGVVLLVVLARRPRAVRYRIDGHPGVLRAGEPPLDVKRGDTVIGDLRLGGDGLSFRPRPPFRLATAGDATADPAQGMATAPTLPLSTAPTLPFTSTPNGTASDRARTRTSRGASAPVAGVAERVLPCGRNGQWATYTIEVVADAPSPSSWSDPSAAAAATRHSVPIEVARLEAEAARDGRPPRTGRAGKQ